MQIVYYIKDNAAISDWAAASVNDMTSLEILLGNEAGEFEPKRNTTKEQMILALARLNDKMK